MNSHSCCRDKHEMKGFARDKIDKKKLKISLCHKPQDRSVRWRANPHLAEKSKDSHDVKDRSNLCLYNFFSSQSREIHQVDHVQLRQRFRFAIICMEINAAAERNRVKLDCLY